MAKKKKKKLTKEEKAAMKLLKKQRAEEKKRRLRMDNLAREQRMAEASWKELKRYFRHMITKMQMPAVRQAMETMWHSYDSSFDHKRHAIERLAHDLGETEELRHRGVATHAAALDSLIALMDERGQEAYDTYKHNRGQLLAAGDRTRERMQESGMTTRVNFNLVAGAMSARAQEAETTAQGDYLTRLDDERDKLNDARKLLKGVLERQLDYSWRGLRLTLSQYEASAEQRRKRLAVVAARDARAAALLQRQEVHVQQLEGFAREEELSITPSAWQRTPSMKRKQQGNIKTYEQQMRYRLAHEHPATQLRAPLAEVRYFASAYCALRQRLDSDRALDHHQLTELVAHSGHALQTLRRLVAKAERILSMATMCRKLETFKERVAPPGALEPRAHSPSYSLALSPPYSPLRSPFHAALYKQFGSPKGDFNSPTSPEDLPLLSAYALLHEIKEDYDEDSLSMSGSSSSTGLATDIFWRRVALADTRRSDLLLRRNALRMERAALVRALRCCLRVDEDTCPPARTDTCALPCEDICAPLDSRLSLYCGAMPGSWSPPETLPEALPEALPQSLPAARALALRRPSVCVRHATRAVRDVRVARTPALLRLPPAPPAPACRPGLVARAAETAACAASLVLLHLYLLAVLLLQRLWRTAR